MGDVVVVLGTLSLGVDGFFFGLALPSAFCCC